METAPNMAVFGLILYRIIKPSKVSAEAIIKPELTEILPAAIGLFFVLSINLSKSFSMIWLNALEAPTIQYPPTASINKVIQLNDEVSNIPRKYPATDEKTTLIDKPALVISLKSI